MTGFTVFCLDTIFTLTRDVNLIMSNVKYTRNTIEHGYFLNGPYMRVVLKVLIVAL